MTGDWWGVLVLAALAVVLMGEALAALIAVRGVSDVGGLVATGGAVQEVRCLHGVCFLVGVSLGVGWVVALPLGWSMSCGYSWCAA